MVIWIINFIPYQTGKLYSNILQDIKYIYIRSNIKNVCGSGYMMIKSKIGREGKTLFFNLIFHRKCVGIIFYGSSKYTTRNIQTAGMDPIFLILMIVINLQTLDISSNLGF
jgi:hypothetical protein